ncbi:hypothetical protein BRE01_29140 [Brevibacillus reuszeri]|uniref:MFS transporter n=1 Tax=Brevibacillus reuszeri TaxID=54915 RepID=A0ABQ0TN03_9BACL|nr:hypothetical protein BRE01_29140 [Brevibacillus reuszeri]
MGNQKTFPLLLVNMFLAMLGIGLVIPVLPQFLHEFGAGGQAAGYLALVDKQRDIWFPASG